MRTYRTTRTMAAVATVLATTALPMAAQATSGYFALGYGPVARGAGGAGVAHASDAMGAALNPASVAGLGRELDYGAELFLPDRGYGDDTFFLAPGGVRSESPAFVIPNFAYNVPLANGSVLNFAAYGNGGLNTDYADVSNPNCAGLAGMVPPDFYAPGITGTGVFCGGAAGVDLMQLFVQATYAARSGAVSWGIAPTIAVQRFEAHGLGVFAARHDDAEGAPYFSADPDHMTDRGYSLSAGAGLKAGISIEVAPTVTLGIAGQTRFDMSELEDYAGLFEGGGDFDIPASVTVGIAIEAGPAVTVLADYQRIYYSGVPAISNATDTPAPFGSDGGPGFGWDDVDVYKIGVEWASSPGTTWRAGYAHASNPVGPEDATLNVLAPGVVEDHFTFGGSRVMANGVLDFAIVFVPEGSTTGPETTPFGPTGQNVTLDMNQISATIGWRRTF